ncbi:hypothetical protein LOD99_13201 [Oopsacas minuta]|uniref:G-protein coupled receptors family 1 profile domain-containing protein n=1 Tax=Oopsacas minuta TaxID=111878 RepID=A0AAV7JB43_9METZ|nr:hypothetical protein LOD99_13201 [Oopsacas minuta]
MFVSWIITSISVGLAYIVFLVAFIFWFLYLLHDVIKRRTCYKSALRSIQEYTDQYQQQVVYRAQTEYVKSIFLSSINIVEWIAITSGGAAMIYYCLKNEFICSRKFDESVNSSNPLDHFTNVSDCFKILSITDILNSHIFSELLLTGYNFFLLSITLVGCLSNYLTARYARKSWITNSKVPYFIALAFVFMLITQISTLFCSLTLIIRCVHCVVSVVALVFAIQQSWRLRMVINWTVVDLEISQNNKRSLIKFKKMSKRLSNLFYLLWIGCFLALITVFMENIKLVIELILQFISEDNHDYSLCTLHNQYLSTSIAAIFDVFNGILSITGILLIYFPYILSGYIRMSVIIWLRIRGRTGYRTHFPNPLRKPLIS